MSTRSKKILLGFSGFVALYFVLYFASVSSTSRQYKGAVIVSPIYLPFDGGLVRAVFTPAYLIDAAYFRRAHWEPRNPA